MLNNPQQKPPLENRVDFLEAKIKELELRLSRIEQSATKVLTAPRQSVNVQNNKISINLLDKKFHTADYNAGDSGDRIDFAFEFTNHLEKDVRAFNGSVIFKDLFERSILKMGMTDERGIRSNATSQWIGGIKYNQFKDEHNRLLSVEKNDLITEFILEKVIYVDGTRESFSE